MTKKEEENLLLYERDGIKLRIFKGGAYLSISRRALMPPLYPHKRETQKSDTNTQKRSRGHEHRGRDVKECQQPSEAEKNVMDSPLEPL